MVGSWDKGEDSRRRSAAQGLFFFVGFFSGEGWEVMECRGPVCCGNPRSPSFNPTSPLQSFLTPEKAKATELPFAMQIMSMRKEKRSRESMVLYQSADC